MNNVDELAVQLVLAKIGITYNEAEVNKEGWVRINSPLRSDTIASFGLNTTHGGWIDHGKGQRGNLIQLVSEVKKISYSQAAGWIKKITCENDSISRDDTSKLIVLKAHAPSTMWNNEFWAGRANELLEAQDKLKREPNHPLVEIAKRYDHIEYSTLVGYGCGITAYPFGSQVEDALLIPYETGCQVYTRDHNDRKVIRAQPGSKPGESFFGLQHCDGVEELWIAQSPRETMMIHQLPGYKIDVIGLASGESSKLSDRQGTILEYLTRHKVKRIRVLLDCDTDSAYERAKKFSQNVADVVPESIQVGLINVFKQTGGQAKNLTEAVRDDLVCPEIFENFEPILPTRVANSKFWVLDVNKDGVITVKVDEAKMMLFLEKEGFCKAYFGRDSEILYNTDGIIHKITQEHIIDHIGKEISSFPEIIDYEGKYPVTRDLLYNAFIKDRGIERTRFLKKLKPRQITPHCDTNESSYLYFENGVVKVRQDSVELFKFSDIEEPIWKEEILPRQFNYDPKLAKRSVFDKFLERVAGQNPQQIDCVKSAIGYLLHRYKDPSNTKAVIFVDQAISRAGESNGGTGKSLTAKAIGKIRKQNSLGGKQFDPNNRFAFQNVDINAKSLFIDDVKADFDFESMFNVVTDDMQIERKHRDQYTVPFKDSPKVIITTNSTLNGSGNSHERRQFIVEFSDYYNRNRSPITEFGHLFYSEWDADEWLAFDHLMVECLQLYLSKGLVGYHKNYERRRLIDKTDRAFAEYCDQHLEVGHEYNNRDLFSGNTMTGSSSSPLDSEGKPFESFLCATEGLLEENQLRTFNNWLDEYAIYKRWNRNKRKSNSDVLTWFEDT